VLFSDPVGFVRVRSYSPNNFERSSFSIPSPWSSTAKFNRLSLVQTWRLMFVLAFENLAAFETRFSSTSRMRSGSIDHRLLKHSSPTIVNPIPFWVQTALSGPVISSKNFPISISALRIENGLCLRFSRSVMSSASDRRNLVLL
jgi:hypothetical protein